MSNVDTFLQNHLKKAMQMGLPVDESLEADILAGRAVFLKALPVELRESFGRVGQGPGSWGARIENNAKNPKQTIVRETARDTMTNMVWKALTGNGSGTIRDTIESHLNRRHSISSLGL